MPVRPSTWPPSSSDSTTRTRRGIGFRYCVFVAGRPREALLPGMAAALDADRDSELHRALDAVVDIAVDRHAKLSVTTAETRR